MYLQYVLLTRTGSKSVKSNISKLKPLVLIISNIPHFLLLFVYCTGSFLINFVLEAHNFFFYFSQHIQLKSLEKFSKHWLNLVDLKSTVFALTLIKTVELLFFINLVKTRANAWSHRKSS